MVEIAEAEAGKTGRPPRPAVRIQQCLSWLFSVYSGHLFQEAMDRRETTRKDDSSHLFHDHHQKVRFDLQFVKKQKQNPKPVTIMHNFLGWQNLLRGLRMSWFPVFSLRHLQGTLFLPSTSLYLREELKYKQVAMFCSLSVMHFNGHYVHLPNLPVV